MRRKNKVATSLKRGQIFSCLPNSLTRKTKFKLRFFGRGLFHFLFTSTDVDIDELNFMFTFHLQSLKFKMKLKKFYVTATNANAAIMHHLSNRFECSI